MLHSLVAGLPLSKFHERGSVLLHKSWVHLVVREVSSSLSESITALASRRLAVVTGGGAIRALKGLKPKRNIGILAVILVTCLVLFLICG